MWWSGVEATYVASSGDHQPWLALWGGAGGVPLDGADAELELVVPVGTRVRRRTLPVRRLALRDAIDDLVRLSAAEEVSGSVRAWAVAVRLAVDLAARGRLLPSIAADGSGVWVLGPLDAADVSRRAALAAALPPAAHAVPLPGPKPLRVMSPEAAVASFSDAVADLLPRTAAAPLVAGHAAFATPAVTGPQAPRRGARRQAGHTSPGAAARQPIAPEPGGGDGLPAAAADWLVAVTAGTGDEAAASLRLEPPEPPDADFLAVLQLQSRRDPSLVVSAADLWAAPDAVVSRFGEEAETAMLLSLRRGSRVWPPLGRLLDDARPEFLVLDDDEAADLLGPVVDDLASAGVQVLWPVDVLRPVELRPQIATPSPAAVTAAGFSLESLCELRWRATLDGEELTDEELAILAHAKRPVVRLRGRWVRADPERLALLARRRTIGAGSALAAALGGSIEVDGERVEADVVGPLAELAARLSAVALDGHRAMAPPAGLDATLRPYQERGLAWLAEMADLGVGGVLADDMGLGKTIQLLALHLARDSDPATRRPTLVVCPASLVGNWQREAGRFAPGVAVRRFHGSARTLDDLGSGDIIVTTYGVVRRDAEALATVGWGIVAADEAQAVKNPLSRTARALRSIPAGARFALTGTPVENRLTELWAILDWTTPGLLGPLERFRRQVAVPVERDRDPDATRTLTTLVRPFVLRRRKSDPAIVPELPPKTETDRFVPLSSEQATLYAAVVEETLARIAEAEGMARRGLVLKLITALKQICNHPAHYLGQPGPLPGRSGKLDAAVELLGVIAEEGAHALVFTQYVAMGRLLERHLGAAGLSTLFLHGSVPVPAREAMVDRFQAGEADVFVVSLKAGGTGLNLTRATHVVHFDRWWNPAVEDQASDRAWRIGQDQPVQVHRLITEGTVEERVASLLTAKRDLADRVLGAGEGWVSELGDAELAALVRLGGDWAGGVANGAGAR
ncbi:MAG TPA: SNF2-related protein [Acidimicrobiales bacterium]|nr:SNF2-related protein [Acidimicrobiales bacterium]